MPKIKNFQNFAKSALVKPITKQVGRGGSDVAGLDVIQEVAYVKEEDKMDYLLECLQKTVQQVLIFAEKDADVDSIHEFLLKKNVEAVALHGGKDVKDIMKALVAFLEGTKAVITTDATSKGLHFPNIHHVVSYDMPEEIENYVHRIGRAASSGETGLATTFINNGCSESVMTDLKVLLNEAKQKVPHFLRLPRRTQERGCTFCRGLDHHITDCHKRAMLTERQVTNFGVRKYIHSTFIPTSTRKRSPDFNLAHSSTDC